MQASSSPQAQSKPLCRRIFQRQPIHCGSRANSNKIHPPKGPILGEGREPRLPAARQLFYSSGGGSGILRRGRGYAGVGPSGEHKPALRRISRDGIPTPALESKAIRTEADATGLEGDRTRKLSTAAPDEDAKRGLRQVRSLFLCCRNLRSLRHVQHLEHMTGLCFLNVHMNLLRQVEHLQHLRQLQELDLSANEIESLSSKCFDGLHLLRRLNLSSNYLQAIPDGVLCPLRSLEWISFGFNSLHDIQGLRSIPSTGKLVYVDLCGNHIGTLDEVETALCHQRGNIQELRLETPKTAAALMVSSQMPEVSVVAATDTPPYMFLRDNPCCSPHVAYPGGTCASDRQGQKDLSPPARLRTLYVERVLEYFPHLIVFNGVSYGLDPMAMPQGKISYSREAVPCSSHSPENQPRSIPIVSSALPFSMDFTSPSLCFPAYPTSFAYETCPSSEKCTDSASSNSSSSDSSRHGSPCKSRETHAPCTTASSPKTRSLRKEDAMLPTTCHSDDNHMNSPSVDISETVHHTTPSPNKESASDATPGTSGRAPFSHFVETRMASAKAPTSDIAATQTSLPSPPYSPLHHYEAKCPRDASLGSHDNCIASLKWRPKRTSRGINTTVTLIRSASSAATDEQSILQMELEESNHRADGIQLQLQRMQEQLGLRLAIEGDIRRHLDLARQRCLELDRERTEEVRHRKAQVSALREELVRRAQEASIIRKKHLVELEEQLKTCNQQWSEKVQRERAQNEDLKTAMSSIETELKSVHDARTHEQKQMQEQCERLHTASRALQCESEKLCRELHLLQEQQKVERCGWQGERAALLLQMDECGARHALTVAAFAPSPSSVVSGTGNYRVVSNPVEGLSSLLHIACKERWHLLQEWGKARQMWEEYIQALQHHYQTALEHAHGEVKQLEEKVETMERQMRAGDGAPHSKPDSPTTSAFQRCDVGCDPLPKAERCHTSTQTMGPCEETPSLPILSLADEAFDTEADGNIAPHSLYSYWRGVSLRQSQDLQRLQRAVSAAEETQQLLSQENARLLQHVTTLQSQLHEQSAEHQRATGERDNLLRTLHNLEDTLCKKDAVIEELEEEAHAKLAEKRHRIAELEGEVELLKEARATQTQLNVGYQDDIAARTREAEALKQELACIKESAARASAHVLELEREVHQLRHEIASRHSTEEQHAEERMKLVSALSLAREQLVRVHHSHTHILRQLQEKDTALAGKEKELTEMTRQVQTMHEMHKVKQRITLEALSQMMLPDAA